MMESTRGRRARRAAAVLLSVAATACAGPAAPPVAGTVRAGLYTDPLSLSLIGKSDRHSELVARLITDSLVQYDAALDLVPRLAHSWEVTEDGLGVTFRLRAGVRWHDGTPVTAGDVVFSIQKVRDPATENASFMAQFENLTSLEAPDDLTVRATYAEPYADFLEAWTLPIIPEHLAGRDEDLLTGEFARRPVGCGPFRFVSYTPGVEIVLERNADYWDVPPHLERVVLRVVPDDRTAYQALLHGDLSLMVAPPDIWREARRAEEAARLEKRIFYRLSTWHVGWNEDGSNPFFTDPRVRRAMVMALDRPRFVDTVLAGLAKPAATTWHPDSVWADPEIEPWPYDPTGAIRLLEEAGWTDTDGDGTRDREGRPFVFRLMIPESRQDLNDRMAAWMQQSLADVGVRVVIDKLEWKAFRERRNTGQFEGAMFLLNFTPIPDQFELYHSSASTKEGGLNYFGLRDAEVDRLLEEGRTTFEPEERRAVYRRLQRRLHELEPISALFHFASPLLHDPRLRGIQPAALDVWRITPGPRAWRWAEDAED